MDRLAVNAKDLTSPELAALRAVAIFDPRLLDVGFPLVSLLLAATLYIGRESLSSHDVYMVIMLMFIAYRSLYRTLGFSRLMKRYERAGTELGST